MEKHSSTRCPCFVLLPDPKHIQQQPSMISAAPPAMAVISAGFHTSHSNKICPSKCYIHSPFHPVRYRHIYFIKGPSPSTLMIRMSRRNSAANSARGENLFGDAEEPVFKSGASSDATPISPAICHFLYAVLKWVYVIIIVSTIGRTQNPQVTWAVMGIIVSAQMSKILKVLFNQRRPSTASGIKEDPGMPSSHAYTLLYTTVYIAIALIGWKGLNIITFGTGLAIILFGAFMAWLRSVEGVHTQLQVMVGIMLGSWYYAWNTVMIRHLYFFNKVRIFLHLGSLIALLNL